MGSIDTKNNQASVRVRFSPFASRITVPSHDVCFEDSSSLWYSKEEMHRLARAEVDALVLAQQSAVAATKAVACGNSSSSQTTTKTMGEEESALCRRGLEIYIAPGQLVIRQRRRRAYRDATLRKRQLLLTLCNNQQYGSSSYNSKRQEEVATRLQQFLVVLSRECRDESLALGVQDALDAQTVYHEESNNSISVKAATAAAAPLLVAEHMAASSTAITSSSMTKQVLTAMRNNHATNSVLPKRAE